MKLAATCHAPGIAAVAFSLLLMALQAPAWATTITIDTVPVGNPGNAGEVQSQGTFGAVDYNYRIGTYEVTNAQYTAFLNEKAKVDPLSLYNTSMGGGTYGGITRGGGGTDPITDPYVYAVRTNMGDKPVNYVNWYDAIRFTNWLHNGQGTGDTETGAYTLEGGTPTPSNANSITRNFAVAKWWLPSEDEWYKAAYHKNDGVTGNYWDYPTGSDTAPTAEAPPGGANSANYWPAVGTVSEVGAYVDSVSPYGTFDQGGNVWEWNEALISGPFRGFRGGAFVNFASTFQSSSRYSLIPTSKISTYGFRVATVPEPSTAVLGMIGCALLWWWRRKR